MPNANRQIASLLTAKIPTHEADAADLIFHAVHDGRCPRCGRPATALLRDLGDKKINLAPGESEPFRIRESLRVSLWTPDIYGQKLLPAHIKNYRFKPNYRYLMILFPPVLRGSADADVRFLSESLEPPRPRR